MFRESKLRSIVKALSWRISGSLTTSLLVFILTGRLKIALAVGAFEFIAKMVIYFFHERLWDKISFGRKELIPFVVWFTGLPASGKGDFADSICKILAAKSFRVERLDGAKLRVLLPLTGFSRQERDNHVKKTGLLASILEKNKVVVVASFVSPYKEARDFVRKTCNNFIEVYINTPLEECERRDTKGLYKKARQGLIKNFTGIDDPYEVPENPEIVINTQDVSFDKGVEKIASYLRENNFLN